MEKTLKFDKTELKSYILKRYPANIADNFLSCLGLAMSWNLDTFIEAMEMFINLPIDTHFKIAFDAYDFNYDGLLTELDLFQGMRVIESNLFVETLCSDITSIFKSICNKKKHIVSFILTLAGEYKNKENSKLGIR